MNTAIFEFTNMNDILLLNHSPEIYFEDMNGEKFYEEVIAEATTGATKGNIFQRLWDLIKKFLRWISRAIEKIKNWMSGKRNTVNVNQVLSDLQVISSDKNKKDFYNSAEIKNNAAKFQVRDINNNNVELSVPMIVEGVMCVCRDKKLIINVSPGKAGSVFPNRNKKYIQDNKTREVGELYLAMVLLCIINKGDFEQKFVNQLIEIGNAFNKDGNLSKIIDYKIITDYMNYAYSAYFINNRPVTIVQEQLDDFQKIIDKCQNIIEKITTAERMMSLGGNDAKMAEVINRANIFLARLQMGINRLIQSLSSGSAIKPEYFNSVNDPVKLSQIVDQLLERGVTGKYMESIIYFISGPALCGAKGEGDGHFIAGESRCILFPKTNKKIVYKVGYSGWGRSSNKSEVLSSNIIVNRVPRLTEYIAKASQVPGSNSYVVTQQERIDGDTCSLYSPWVYKIGAIFNGEFRKNGINFQIQDLHGGNMIMPKGKSHPIVIDYGWGELASAKK